MQLSEFEHELNDLTASVLAKAYTKILNGSNTDLLEKWIKKIDIDYRFKASSARSDNDEKWIISSEESAKEANISKLSPFIVAPVEILIFDVLWIDCIGFKLDSTVSSRSKGNRLYRHDGKYVPEFDSIFAPYYLQYRSWRNNGLKVARHLNAFKKDCAILSYDIVSFYGSIDSAKFLDAATPGNNALILIHKQFCKIYNKKNTSKKSQLPIGLLSSPVIANYALNEFDEAVRSKVECKYYGRYVDDIIVVIEGNKWQAEKFEKSIVRTKKGKTYLRHTSQDLEINLEKSSRFYFDAKCKAVELAAYLQELKKTSSEYRFVPDIPSDGIHFHINSLELNFEGSVNKVRSIIGANFSRSKASKALTDAIKALSIAPRNTGKQFYAFSQAIKDISAQGKIEDRLFLAEKTFCALCLLNDTSGLISIFKRLCQDILNASTNQPHLDSTIMASKATQYNDLLVCLAMGLATKSPTKIDELVSEVNSASDLMRGALINVQDFEIVTMAKAIYEANMFRNSTSLHSFLMEAPENEKLSHPHYGAIDQRKLNSSPRFIHFHEKYFNDFLLSLNRQERTNNSDFLLKNSWENFIEKHKPSPEAEIRINLEAQALSLKITITKKKERDVSKIGITNFGVSDADSINSIKGSPNLSVERYRRVMKLLNEGISEGCDILVFPEMAIPILWYNLIAEYSRRNEIVVIGGFEHFCTLSGQPVNVLFTFLPFRVGSYKYVMPVMRPKIHSSPEELSVLNGVRPGVRPITGRKLYTINYGGISFCTFNCFELADINLRSAIADKVIAIFAIEHNKDTEYFRNIGHSFSRDLHSLFIQVNSKDYGDSRVIGPFPQEHRDMLVVSRGESEHVHALDYNFRKHQEFIDSHQSGSLSDPTVWLTSGRTKFKPIPPRVHLQQ